MSKLEAHMVLSLIRAGQAALAAAGQVVPSRRRRRALLKAATDRPGDAAVQDTAASIPEGGATKRPGDAAVQNTVASIPEGKIENAVLHNDADPVPEKPEGVVLPMDAIAPPTGDKPASPKQCDSAAKVPRDDPEITPHGGGAHGPVHNGPSGDVVRGVAANHLKLGELPSEDKGIPDELPRLSYERPAPYTDRLSVVSGQLSAHSVAAQLQRVGFPSASRALDGLKPFLSAAAFEELRVLDQRGGVAKHRGFVDPEYSVPPDRPARRPRRCVGDAIRCIEERILRIESLLESAPLHGWDCGAAGQDGSSEVPQHPDNATNLARDHDEEVDVSPFCSVLAVCAEADDLGYLPALRNLASRPEAKGADARGLLSALKETGGLVNPAKKHLLRVGDQRHWSKADGSSAASSH